MGIIEEKAIAFEQELDKRTNTSIFKEVPVDLNTFLYNEQFLNIKKLSDKQYEFIKHGTNIYRDTEIAELKWEPVRKVSELVALWGKGGGKDLCSQIIQMRVAYLLLCLNNPQKYYDLEESASIDMLNMAYSADQAEAVFFNTFVEMIKNCGWFNNKYSVKSRVIEFNNRIFGYSGNSFEEAFEGKNLIVSVLDEIAAFKTKMEVEQMSIRRLRAPRYSAESVYDMAKSSIESRFPRCIGKLISLSFPRFKNDYIQQLYAKGKDETTCFTSFGATWEVNPYRTRADFDDEFRKNPERAEARYACNPRGVEDGYFRNKPAIQLAFPLIDYEKVPTTHDRFPAIKPWFKCNHTSLCSVHLDLSLKHDKAGLCLSHISKLIQDVRANPDGEKVTTQLPVVTIDVFTSFIAPINGEIDFSIIREFIVDLMNRGFKIGKLTCDQFQSADFLQIISKLGIETDNRSVDRNTDAYDCLKELIYDNRIQGYSYIRDIPGAGTVIQVNEVLDELSNLILIGGRKVDHPAYGGKDNADAIAGSVQGAIELGYTQISASDIVEGSDRVAIMGDSLSTSREYLTAVTDEYFSEGV